MQTLRFIAELLYFLSGPVIALIAWKGLEQLKIAKDNAKMSARRESYKLAADQISYYNHTVIPLLNRLDDVIKEKKLTVFANAVVNISEGKISVSYKNNDKDSANQIVSIAQELSDALNSLEGFSIFFTSRVAAEDIAFSAVGSTFCKTVHQYLPAILLIQGGNIESLEFRPIIELFLLWNERLENLKLSQDKKQIESKLKELNNRFIDPLGT